MKAYVISIIAMMVGIGIVSSHAYAADATTDIREVKLRFCDEPTNTTGIKQLFIETKPNQQEEICIDISNDGNTPATLWMNFVDGALTADFDQKKACLPEWEKSGFGQYVTWFTETIEIPANSTVRTKAQLLYPDWYAGDSYGCVTLHVINQTQKTLEQDGQVFQVFSRLWYFVDAFVDGKFIIKVVATPQTLEKYTDIWHNTLLPIYQKEKKYFVRAGLYNTWNITVTGTINLGYTAWRFFGQEDIYTWQTIVPKQRREIEKEIPWYITYLVWWPIKTTVNMNYFPVFRGRTTDPHQWEVFTLHENNTVFLTPRWLIALLLIILLILLYIRKRRKTRYQKRTKTYWETAHLEEELTIGWEKELTIGWEEEWVAHWENSPSPTLSKKNKPALKKRHHKREENVEVLKISEDGETITEDVNQ